jgi:Na+-transporting NADH:ubiquinone oxidoreductase subunit NqrC
MISINLKFDNASAHRLWHTGMRSFYTQQSARFEVVDDNGAEMGIKSVTGAELSSRGVFLWFDRYLDAKVYQAYYEQTRINDWVLFWDTSGEYRGYVLWLDERGDYLS